MKTIPYVIKYFKEVIFTDYLSFFLEKYFGKSETQSIYDTTLNQKIDENIARFI